MPSNLFLTRRRLLKATGAGAAARNSVGTTVVGGMITSTFLSVVFIPVLYVVFRAVFPGRKRALTVENAVA